MKKAIVLLSGGLDSATTLYIARDSGFKPFCMIFDYGQRHAREIKSARRLAQTCGCDSKIVRIKLPWGGSALTSRNIAVPAGRDIKKITRGGIPITYVPARNTIFLSFALSWAEAIKAQAIFIGANALDFSGYPDCRPEFYRAFSNLIRVGTKAGAEGKIIKILTPLINKGKGEIIKIGMKLGVPYELTWSCYKGGKTPCRKCDSCLLRAKGFREAGVEDPLI